MQVQKNSEHYSTESYMQRNKTLTQDKTFRTGNDVISRKYQHNHNDVPFITSVPPLAYNTGNQHKLCSKSGPSL
jgi:hypothetical protein